LKSSKQNESNDRIKAKPIANPRKPRSFALRQRLRNISDSVETAIVMGWFISLPGSG
jgi:hypothetical protein